MQSALYQYLLMLGDNSMILGHRLSELCGHGPNLETDIALTNISLDLFGQVRSYFQYAAKVKGNNATEDSIAFLRRENEYRNVLLVEQENKDFAHIIVRQFLFDCYHLSLLEQLSTSADDQIKAIAAKSIKEARYHYRFSSEWTRRLALGTDISREKYTTAFEYLYPYINEFFQATDFEKTMAAEGIAPDLKDIKASFDTKLLPVIEEVDLSLPSPLRNYDKGKSGIHSEYLGYILADLQYMQRAYPNMEW